MNKYIALLRGINVSGKNIIKMSELQLLLVKIGLLEVKTYIQSGNIAFNSEKSSDELHALIKNSIFDKFNLDVPALVINFDNFNEINSRNPFLDRENISLDKLHITFLDEVPPIDLINLIDKSFFLPDEFIVSDNVIYLHCPNGYGNTKLSNTFFERKLKTKATTRNLKTINELIKISELN